MPPADETSHSDDDHRHYSIEELPKDLLERIEHFKQVLNAESEKYTRRHDFALQSAYKLEIGISTGAIAASLLLIQTGKFSCHLDLLAIAWAALALSILIAPISLHLLAIYYENYSTLYTKLSYRLLSEKEEESKPPPAALQVTANFLRLAALAGGLALLSTFVYENVQNCQPAYGDHAPKTPNVNVQ